MSDMTCYLAKTKIGCEQFVELGFRRVYYTVCYTSLNMPKDKPKGENVFH
jgi:hypothetical protein